MSTLSSQESARGRANRWSTIEQQLLTGVGGVLMLFSPVVLCLAAGRWNWLAGWLFGLTLVISIIVSRALVAIKSPGLLAERARWVKGEKFRRLGSAPAPGRQRVRPAGRARRGGAGRALRLVTSDRAC